MEYIIRIVHIKEICSLEELWMGIKDIIIVTHIRTTYFDRSRGISREDVDSWEKI